MHRGKVLEGADQPHAARPDNGKPQMLCQRKQLLLGAGLPDFIAGDDDGVLRFDQEPGGLFEGGWISVDACAEKETLSRIDGCADIFLFECVVSGGEVDRTAWIRSRNFEGAAQHERETR